MEIIKIGTIFCMMHDIFLRQLDYDRRHIARKYRFTIREIVQLKRSFKADIDVNFIPKLVE